MAIAFHEEAARTAKSLKLGEAGIAEFGASLAQIAQTEEGVVVLGEFGEKPCGTRVREKEFRGSDRVPSGGKGLRCGGERCEVRE